MSWSNDDYLAAKARLEKASKKISPLPKNAHLVREFIPTSNATSLECNISISTDVAKLNKTERAYLGYIETLKKVGQFQWIGVQSTTFKLADDCRYTPDFITLELDGKVTAREVKGFFRDDAKVKIKVAARMFPWVQFVLVRKIKGGWHHEPVKP